MKGLTGLVAGFAVIASLGTALADEWRQPLRDGFDGPDFSAEGGLYYRDNFEQSAGRVVFQDEVVRTGPGALKLSVEPICGDRPDCSERAEIWEKTPLRVPYDQGIWFGFAIKFADPVPQDDHRYLIAQWKREIGPEAKGDFSPFFALRMNRGSLFATVETNYQPPIAASPDGDGSTCRPGLTPIRPAPETNQMQGLVAADPTWTAADTIDRFTACTDRIEVIDRGNPLPSPKSGWIDFATYTKPGPDGTGQIEIFANKKWVASVRGFVGHGDPGLGVNQYFKFGPYRAATKGEWTLYYDDFRRSPKCEDVLADSAACARIE